MGKSKRKCEFCRKPIDTIKWSSHRCKGRLASFDFYNEWKGNVDEDMLKRYPQHDSWLEALTKGEIHVPDHPLSPQEFPSSSEGVKDVGDNAGGSSGDQGVSTVEVSQERQPKGSVADPGSTGLIKPSDLIKKAGEKYETAATVVSTIKDAYTGVEEPEQIRFSPRERGWLGAIALFHTVEQFLTKAKEKKTAFSLDKKQKKRLAASAVARWGECPLAKNLKVEGTGEYAVHPIVAFTEVYGEHVLENHGYIFDRGKSAFDKIREWRDKLRSRKKEKKKEDAAK